MSTLENKVAIVTGSTSGIGRASSMALANAGARVVVSGRREAEGESVVHEIVSAGGDARFVRTDVTREADVQRLVDETLVNFGRLDVALNNAGVESIGRLVEFTVPQYRQAFDVNVLGVLLSLKYEVPAMLATGGGSIINMSSVGGHIGAPDLGIYVATKHAVEGITKTAALELAQQNIRVNAVAPGAIETDMIERFVGLPGSQAREQMAAIHPLGRMGCVEEVAAAVVFLASDAASFITGSSLPIDGGWLAK